MPSLSKSCPSFICILSSSCMYNCRWNTQHNVPISAQLTLRKCYGRLNGGHFYYLPHEMFFFPCNFHDFSCIFSFKDKSSLEDNDIEIASDFGLISLCSWLYSLLYPISVLLPLKYQKFKDNEISSEFMPQTIHIFLEKLEILTSPNKKSPLYLLNDDKLGR